MRQPEPKKSACHLIPSNLFELASKAPEKRLRCKFVLIETDEEYYLVVGTVSEFEYHSNLVERFCSDQGLPFGWYSNPDRVRILDMNVKIRGGGSLSIDANSGLLRIYGDSTAYGPYDPDTVKQTVQGCEKLASMSILVDD
jgi:hypothetical protein